MANPETTSNRTDLIAERIAKTATRRITQEAVPHSKASILRLLLQNIYKRGGTAAQCARAAGCNAGDRAS
jgi:hypothetical protein